jgi:DNA-binding NtrC family response regulator
MARVLLDIDDMVNQTTLEAMLRAAGHEVVGVNPEVRVTDDPLRAIHLAREGPVLVLAAASGLRAAIAAMRQGVHGYIFLPFQPGEADLMVRRATHAAPEDPAAPMETLSRVEERHIREVLRRCKGNRARAAKILGIGRNTLWRKLRAMDSARRDGEDPSH